jgi:photosystem II stability/assembly factor-like uncharacterized protein
VSASVQRIIAADSLHAWASGLFEGVLTTVDGGANWTLIPAGGTAYGRRMCFISSTEGWVSSSNGLYHTVDGGANWTRLTADFGVQGELSFATPQVGWMLGWENQLYRTEDGGATWTLQSLTNSLGWYPVTLRAVSALECWVTGYSEEMGALVLVTTDGGATWREEAAHSDAVTDLCVLDAAHAWACGHSGTILRYRAPEPNAVSREHAALPERPGLIVYPNPFNASATLAFDVPVAGVVTLTVYDVTGRQVATLADRVFAAGEQKMMLDGSRLSSGVYFVRMTGSRFGLTRKLVLLK